MIHRIFSIYDTKAKAYLPPFILPEEAMAVRTFGDCVNRDDHQFHAHPEDYSLFCLGIFDDKIGEIVHNAPEIVATGLELVDTTKPSAQLNLVTDDQEEGTAKEA